MKKHWLKATIACAAVAVSVGVIAAPAGATPPSGYGFDDSAHVIVGGGSDTTYRAMVGLTDLYNGTTGCNVDTGGTSSNLNNCLPNVNPELDNFGNYQHDTVAQANPTGSGAGVNSLLGLNTYHGTVNDAGVDFARSSRGPSGSELSSLTFWGYAQDGIQIVVFNNRGSIATGADPVTNAKMSPQELHDIYTCAKTQWNQVTSLGIAPGDPNDGPIVPWGVNSASGTYATFRDYIRTATGDSLFDPNAGACVRKLAVTSAPPFENDIKPLINDPASLSASASSTDNPENWIWWGSYGEFTAFNYKSVFTRSSVTYTAKAAPVLGYTPSLSNISSGDYPIGRTLYHVTKKADADCPKTSGVCDFTGNPGPTANATAIADLNVTGGASGKSGAVREFTRWICRSTSTRHAIDPYTGANYFNEITTAISKAGFVGVPNALKTAGTRCRVLS